MAFGSHVFFLLCLLAEGARESTDEGVFVQVSRAGQTDAAATATWERQLTDDLPAAGLAVGKSPNMSLVATDVKVNQSEEKNASSSNIVVVSGCIRETNEKYSEDGSELCKIAKRNFQNYCDYQGYRLVWFDEKQPLAEHRKATWSKIVALQKVLEDSVELGSPRVDYVFWMDCDSLFMNFARRLEDFIPKVGTHVSFSPGQFCFLNAGHLMFKNDAWTGRFLEDVWKTYPPPKPWHEQSAMVFTLWSYAEGRGKMTGPDENQTLLETSTKQRRISAAQCREWTREVQLKPDGCCNGDIIQEALHEELGVSLVDQRAMREMNAFEYNFEPGDFILHLAGDTTQHKTLKMKWYEDCVLDPRSSTYSLDYKKLRDLAKERKAHSSMKNWRE